MSTHHFNQLSEPELENLAILAEECAEVIQVIGKILRHGLASKHPSDLSGPDNRKLLEKEIGHIEHAVERLAYSGVIQTQAVIDSRIEKAKNITKYLHHSS